MTIINPPFLIPVSNKQSKQKDGRNIPVYFGDKSLFEKVKRDRVSDLDNLISLFTKNEPTLSVNDDRLYFEIELHEKVTSKSQQPKTLFNSNFIDVEGMVSDHTLLASTTESHLKSFRDKISRLSIDKNRNDSCYISAISKIKTIPTEDILPKGVNLDDLVGQNLFLYLHDSLSENDAQIICNETGLKSELIISDFGAKIIYGKFGPDLLELISKPNPKKAIRKIETSIDFVLKQELTLGYDKNNIKTEHLEGEVKIAVVDSGVFIDDLYADYVIGQESFLSDDAPEDLSHGTFVGTRIIFGHNVDEQIYNQRLTPKAKILDVQVMSGETSDKDVINAIKSIIINDNYSDIKVYNLSLNVSGNNAFANGEKIYITRELDALSKKYNILFVISAGNQDAYWSSKDTDVRGKYPESLFDKDAVLVPPADSINSISVGSIADINSSRSIALNNEPSPFTRSGLLGGVKKPDVTHFGGNVDIYQNSSGIGVKGFSSVPGRIQEGVGTSFSAPIVSLIAGQIYDYLKQSSKFGNEPSMNLVKALLLYSSSYELPVGSKIDQDDVDRLVGFGIPDLIKALDCSQNSATFIYNDKLCNYKTLENNEKKSNIHKIKFSIPEELVSKNKRLKIKCFLAYSPEISTSGTSDYALSDIELNLHYINSRGNQVSGHLTEGGLDYRYKWNPIKAFEKVFTAYNSGEWEITLTLNTRGKIENENYNENYSFIVSIEDVTQDPNNRVNLQEIIKNRYSQYISVDIPIKQKVLVRS
jgi:hypothetical protein